MRELGIAALSALATPPDELVYAAAEAGFNFVGVRVQKVTDTEAVYDLAPGSDLARRVERACRETGVYVLDTEFLLLDGSDQRDIWRSAFEKAQGLGAKTFTVAAADTDRSRLTDTLALMAEDASPAGITVTLEPISYQAVNSLPYAAELARETGVKVLADTLHFTRFGATSEEILAAADTIGGIQLVDGAAQVPADREALIVESRTDRRSPGDGAFDLAGFLKVLPQDMPLSVECCSNEFVAAHGAAAWVKKLYADATALLKTI